MWILPKNYPLSSAFAADMVESKEDLTLPGLNIESSLMSRSKPSALPTWLRRWKADSYLPHLFLRILKPFQRRSFETAVTSSLAVTRANPFQRQECEKERTTQDTSGLSYGDTLQQLDLIECSLKTSRVTSRLDCPQLLPTWKKIVTDQRGEYSQRVKSALLTRESESSSWPTPTTDSASSRTKKYAQGGTPLSMAVQTWPTPTTQDNNQVAGQYKNPRSGTTLGGAVRNWPTVRVSSANGASQKELAAGNPKRRLETEVLLNPWPTPTVQDASKATKKMRDNHQNNLTAVVFSQEAFPTPTTRDWKGGYNEASLTRSDGKSRRFDALPNAAIGGVGTDIVRGHLNPDWVEWLMGVPTGWTELGSWGTESCQQQPPKHGVS
jgi:hypothetical protein